MKAPGEQSAKLEELQPAPAAEVASAPPALGTAFSADSVLALQRSAGNAAVTGRIADAPDDRPLLRAIARSAHERTAPPEHRSPALLLRSQLRSRRLARSITTSGGEWDTDVYDDKINVAPSGAIAPAAQGWRGLDITLKFKPDTLVDAELIGMTQTAQSIKAGAATYLTPTARTARSPVPTRSR